MRARAAAQGTEMSYVSSALQHRVIQCRDFTGDVPSVDMAFKFVYMVKFWLDWHPRHVAVVYDNSDGVRLTAFFVACYMAFADADVDTMQALGIFGAARIRGDVALPNTWKFLLLQVRACRHMHSRMWSCACPNARALQMNAVLRAKPHLADRICLAKVFLHLPEALASSDLSLEVVENGVAVYDSQSSLEAATVGGDGDLVTLAPMLELQVRACLERAFSFARVTSICCWVVDFASAGVGNCSGGSVPQCVLCRATGRRHHPRLLHAAGRRAGRGHGRDG